MPDQASQHTPQSLQLLSSGAQRTSDFASIEEFEKRVVPELDARQASTLVYVVLRRALFAEPVLSF